MEFFSERANKERERERGRVGAASKRADKPATLIGSGTVDGREKVTIARQRKFYYIHYLAGSY